MSAPVTPPWEIDPREARRRQAAGAVLVDVREPGEWALGVPEGARTIALGALPGSRDRLPPPDTELLTICASGRRSVPASNQLAALGFKAMNVEGGTSGWISAGQPVEK